LDTIRLIFQGRVLKDPETLRSYKVCLCFASHSQIEDGHAIHLVPSIPRPPPAPETAPDPASAFSSSFASAFGSAFGSEPDATSTSIPPSEGAEDLRTNIFSEMVMLQQFMRALAGVQHRNRRLQFQQQAQGFQATLTF
jgi:hypothetical protein